MAMFLKPILPKILVDFQGTLVSMLNTFLQFALLIKIEMLDIRLFVQRMVCFLNFCFLNKTTASDSLIWLHLPLAHQHRLLASNLCADF